MVAACAWHDEEHGPGRQEAEGVVLHEPRDALGHGGAGFQPVALGCAQPVALHEDVEVIHLLAKMGLAERIAWDNDSELSKWLFTARGMQTLKIGVEVTAPSPVLRYRRDVPLGDMLPYELVDYLDEKGWRCETLPARFRATQVPCLDLAALALGEASQQVWYLRATATTLNHSYLEALARWEEVYNMGIQRILHLQPPKFYDDIWGSKDQPLPLGDAVSSFCADGLGGFGALADVQEECRGEGEATRRRESERSRRGGRSGRGGRGRRQTQKRREQREEDGESEQEESEQEEKEEAEKEAAEEEEDVEEDKVQNVEGEKEKENEEIREYGGEGVGPVGGGEGLGREVNKDAAPAGPNSEDRGGGERDERVEEEEEDSLGPTPSSSDSVSSPSPSSSESRPESGLPGQQQQRGGGTRGSQKKDARNGRWGSFRCTVVRGNTWEGFQMVCPVHSTSNTSRNGCNRQKV